MSLTLHEGDCLESLRRIDAGSVQCCVTSPPYFGLRDYGHAGQIGLEQTPDAYVAKMVDVFRGVRRVLADDGTLWLNLGDCYTGSGKGGNPEAGKQSTNRGSQSIGVLYGKTGETARQAAVTNVTRHTFDIGAKQLLGIPWRVAFALQSDGWFLRQDIVWHKPNPMPESVRDRCTKAHEYLFLLAKSGTYFFDSDAMQEPAAYAGQMRGGSTNRYEQNAAGMDSKVYDTRNRRSVWSVKPEPYAGAHFAVMPRELVRPCILAGSRPGDVVLDPFGGSGTVAEVAVEEGRRAILCELNPTYCGLIQHRMATVTPTMFATGAA